MHLMKTSAEVVREGSLGRWYVRYLILLDERISSAVTPVLPLVKILSVH